MPWVERSVGIAFGIGTQLLFAWTVVQLFTFLRYGVSSPLAFSWWFDTLLAMSFAVPHSVLLIPEVQRAIRLYLPAGWLGCLHCSITCCSLLIMTAVWTPSPYALWDLDGVGKSAVLGCFYAAWFALLYSISLTGFGYQTGFTQWWYWLRGQTPPRREFVIRGAYRFLRHPIYLSFVGIVWFTPRMSLDHLLLASVWTVYIVVGSMAKDRRMAHYIGAPYCEYAARVGGYPLLRGTPLGKWPPLEA
jgi:protein-S-isoprenylcysteine O-methyltransferase Ste14